MKYLFGASGHAKVVVDVINSRLKENVLGIFDDDETKKQFLNIPFLGLYSSYKKFPKTAKFLICIGNNKIRKFISKKIEEPFFSAVHKKSIISNSVKIGEGTVVMANVVINANSTIGSHCIINTSAIIDHDCIIEDFVHLSPNVTITGNITVGEGSHIGAGTVIIPNIKIGKWCVIGAGSVVLKDVPDYSVVVGNPAKLIKKINH